MGPDFSNSQEIGSLCLLFLRYHPLNSFGETYLQISTNTKTVKSPLFPLPLGHPVLPPWQGRDTEVCWHSVHLTLQQNSAPRSPGSFPAQSGGCTRSARSEHAPLPYSQGLRITQSPFPRRKPRGHQETTVRPAVRAQDSSLFYSEKKGVVVNSQFSECFKYT